MHKQKRAKSSKFSHGKTRTCSFKNVNTTHTLPEQNIHQTPTQTARMTPTTLPQINPDDPEQTHKNTTTTNTTTKHDF